jgi:hypothetical protein
MAEPLTGIPPPCVAQVLTAAVAHRRHRDTKRGLSCLPYLTVDSARRRPIAREHRAAIGHLLCEFDRRPGSVLAKDIAHQRFGLG